MIKRVLLLCAGFWPLWGMTQGNISDSALFVTSVRPSYGAQLPGGDMVKRFGWNSSLGLAVDIKTRKSWLAGLEGNYIFGDQVKEDVVSILRNVDGQIIDQDGAYATILMFERGFSVNAYGGYIWRVLNPNPNSGLMFTGGIGYMQHKIRIEHSRNNVPALDGDYLKGYDRFTSGVNIKEFIGYQLLSNSRLWNVYFGFEFVQGFTRSRRDWNIDQRMRDDSKRMDLFYGFRVGWVLPLYQRAPKEFYY